MKTIKVAGSYSDVSAAIKPVGSLKTTAYLFNKRVFDIVASFFGLVILLPLLIIISIAIRLESPGRAIYAQKRVGKNGRVFTFYKFRSMVNDAELKQIELLEQNEMDGPVFKMTDDPRVTKVGKFIRRTSIDELPQLFNILKGDMTFVGPRPPLPDEVSQYSAYHMNRLQVKGGLTCYWQISGRNTVSFDDWVELDIKYINEMSTKTDAKIFFATFPVVLKRTGAC